MFTLLPQRLEDSKAQVTEGHLLLRNVFKALFISNTYTLIRFKLLCFL